MFYKIEKPDGSYDRDFFPHFQLLDAPTSPVANVTPAAKERISKLRAAFFKGAHREAAAKAYDNLVALRGTLWTPKAMGGAEYERRGFEAYVARDIVKEKFEAMTIHAEVGFDVLLSKEAQQYVGKRTVRDVFGQYGVTLPRTAPAKIHVIAPKDRLRAAAEMIGILTTEREETASHRGISLISSIAYQQLNDADKGKAGQPFPVGWYEIHNGVFFTTDKKMFEQAVTVFAAQEKLPKAMGYRPWHSC